MNTTTHRYKTPWWAETLNHFLNYLMEELGGGKKRVKLAWAINFHKFFTLFLILGFMFYYNNFSVYAWVYLGLHGIYGYCWLIKDFGFRDGSFEAPITLLGAFMLYPGLVGWYWFFPWWFISQHITPANEIMFLAVALHTLGVSLMIAADCQKYFSLKYNRGLMTEGVFAYTRNPNFLGEIMIYAAYALLANHWFGYLVFGYACTYFFARMLAKEHSLSRYPEWEAYTKQSSLLIPWKMFFGRR